MARNHGGRRDRGSSLLSESVATLIARAVGQGWIVIVDGPARGGYHVGVWNGVMDRKLGQHEDRTLKEALRVALLEAYHAPQHDPEPEPARPATLAPTALALTAMLDTPASVVA